MERDSRESEADNDIGSSDRSMDWIASEGEYLSDDAQRSAQTTAFYSFPETLSFTPIMNVSESQYALPEDGPSDMCDPAELSTFGLGPKLVAPSATPVATQHQPLTPDDDFTSLLDFEGASSGIARSATIAMPSNAGEDTIMNTPNGGSMLPTTLTAESNSLAASASDHSDLVMGECGNLLDDVPGFSARSYGNVPLHMEQQLSYPNHPTMMPVQTTESELSTLAVIESTVPDLSHNMSYPTSIRMPSQPIATSQSTENGSTKCLTNVQFPRRGHALLLPKEPVTFHRMITPSIRNAQDIYSSSEVALVPYADSRATKSAQKRLRSPEVNNDFPFIPCKYDSGKDAIVAQAVPSERHSNKKQKRTRCSGFFPCERCLAFFSTGIKNYNYQRSMLRFTACLDSDIMQYNFFLDIHEMICKMESPSIPLECRALTDEEAKSLPSIPPEGQALADEEAKSLSSIPPEAQALTDEEAKSLFNRISLAGGKFMQIVQDLAMEAGISDLLGFQLYRFVLSEMEPPLDVSSPLSWMLPLLSRKPLQIRPDCLRRPMSGQDNQSLGWIFATTMLQPGLVGAMTGLEPHKIQHFSLWICKEFYKETRALLPKPKESKAINEEDRQHRSILIENLMTIHFLTSYHTLQARYISDLVRTMLQVASRPDYITARTDLAETSEPIAQCLELLWYSERHYPAVGIVFRSKLFPVYAFRRGNAFARVTSLLAYILQLRRALAKEGWDHLRDYTRYWLEKLGVGYEGYDVLLTKMFNLNTLCRIDRNLKLEDEGDVRPSVVARMEKLRDETSKVSLEFEPPIPESRRNLIPSLLEICLNDFEQVPTRVIYADEREWIFLLASTTLHTLEMGIAQNFAYLRPKGSRNPPRRALREFPDDALGSAHKCNCRELSNELPKTMKCFQDVITMETIIPLILDKDITPKNHLAVGSALKLLKIRRQQRGLEALIMDHNRRVIERKIEVGMSHWGYSSAR